MITYWPRRIEPKENIKLKRLKMNMNMSSRLFSLVLLFLRGGAFMYWQLHSHVRLHGCKVQVSALGKHSPWTCASALQPELLVLQGIVIM